VALCHGRSPSATSRAYCPYAPGAAYRRVMAHLENHNEEEIVRKDTNESPTSESDTRVKQTESVESSATDDADIDESDITLLPGTGGPDDVGDVEVDPADLNMSGDPRNL
jgi:hypothetical protein